MGERRSDPANHPGLDNTIPMRKSGYATQSTKSPFPYDLFWYSIFPVQSVNYSGLSFGYLGFHLVLRLGLVLCAGKTPVKELCMREELAGKGGSRGLGIGLGAHCWPSSLFILGPISRRSEPGSRPYRPAYRPSRSAYRAFCAQIPRRGSPAPGSWSTLRVARSAHQAVRLLSHLKYT